MYVRRRNISKRDTYQLTPLKQYPLEIWKLKKSVVPPCLWVLGIRLRPAASGICGLRLENSTSIVGRLRWPIDVLISNRIVKTFYWLCELIRNRSTNTDSRFELRNRPAVGGI